ncbi:NAD(P)/FAD-dependent oxidoreductase [Streptomyces sp. NPDC004610]|uniref:phytoene desaturase family protein n=1 Tax=unclassified Streptomyces TaxID=2593676 RepID=UPI0033BE0E05
MRRYDAVIVGAGHNGLVTAAYLGRAGLRVALLESRPVAGGPCGGYEFLPGRRLAFTNSPGSLSPDVVAELGLARYGLRFVRVDPTVVHRFDEGCFVGWRDQGRVDAQLDAFAPGEAGRYRGLIEGLERLGARLGVRLDTPPPETDVLRKRLSEPDDLRLFELVFDHGLTELLDAHLRSDRAKALLMLLALNAQLVPPSEPGSGVGLLMRPFALAATGGRDPGGAERVALRGSTGLPVGSMSAIADALTAACRAHGVELRTGTPVARVLHGPDGVRGVVTPSGEEFLAPRVISTVNPQHLFGDLLAPDAMDPGIGDAVLATPMRGSAFKVVLEVDELPSYAGLPDGTDPEAARLCQFRFGSSPASIAQAIAAALEGRSGDEILMWGLTPTLTSPGLTPGTTHLISVNAWHAPYRPHDGPWDAERTDRFGRRCVRQLSLLMPGLEDRIVAHRFMNPVEMARELGLTGSNITHGDMLPATLFGTRPHPALAAHRTPLPGLYLGGSGTWPGGYVTGIPGRNTAATVLKDLKHANESPRPSDRPSGRSDGHRPPP